MMHLEGNLQAVPRGVDFMAKQKREQHSASLESCKHTISMTLRCPRPDLDELATPNYKTLKKVSYLPNVWKDPGGTN